MIGIGIGLMLAALAQQSAHATGTFYIDSSDGQSYAVLKGKPLAVVKWEDVLNRVQVGIDGQVYNHDVRKAVEARPLQYCRVELVLIHDPALRDGYIGVDLLNVTCPR